MPLTKIKRPVATGQLKVLQKLNPYEFGVELWLMREGVNQNRWNYQNLEKYYKTFVGRPILIAYVMGKSATVTTASAKLTQEQVNSITPIRMGRRNALLERCQMMNVISPSKRGMVRLGLWRVENSSLSMQRKP